MNFPFNEILQDFNNNLTFREMSEKYNIPLSSLYKQMILHGLSEERIKKRAADIQSRTRGINIILKDRNGYEYTCNSRKDFIKNWGGCYYNLNQAIKTGESYRGFKIRLAESEVPYE